MRRPATRAPLRWILLTTLAACCVAGLTVAQAAPGAKPTLRAADLTPLVLVGSGFRPGERVLVTVTYGRRTLVGRQVAGARGTIRLRLRELTLGRCHSELSARASGSAGSRATLRLPALACPPER